MLQLLTCTGARPEAFALCQRWMSRQDYAGPVRWVIVDDGPQAQAIESSSWDVLVVRRKPYWKPGENTQAANTLAGLEHIDPAWPLVCIEDDDWYAPDWLSHVARSLKGRHLVGECRSRYYNVRTKIARELPNVRHASLCATAMQGHGIEAFRDAAQTREKFIDLALWRSVKSRHVFSGHRVVGIKGLPGRGGIGVGHKDTFTGSPDPSGRILRQWIGSDAEVYQ